MHDVDGFAQVVGGSVPARIWHDFMTGALDGTKVDPFPRHPAASCAQRVRRRRRGRRLDSGRGSELRGRVIG